MKKIDAKNSLPGNPDAKNDDLSISVRYIPARAGREKIVYPQEAPNMGVKFILGQLERVQTVEALLQVFQSFTNQYLPVEPGDRYLTGRYLMNLQEQILKVVKEADAQEPVTLEKIQVSIEAMRPLEIPQAKYQVLIDALARCTYRVILERRKHQGDPTQQLQIMDPYQLRTAYDQDEKKKKELMKNLANRWGL
jgi:hypothetical protein